jgi:hypothetical protein
MATWAEFAAAAPDMAELGLRQLTKFGLAYLGTVRADGSPRVNPVCPFIGDGRLFVATAPSSPKRLDLVRDGRYVLHFLPGKEEEEIAIRGRATRIEDATLRAMALEGAREMIQATGLRVKPDEWLFEYAIESAMMTTWADFGTPDHRPVRKSWRAP